MIYAIGGFNGASQYAIVEAYDPATNTWTTQTAMPTARVSLETVAVNNVIYAIGGYNGVNTPLGTNESFSPATTLTTGVNDSSTAFGGAISGIRGLVKKVGAGTQTLSGTNTYSGTTMINGGTLALSNGSNNNIANSSTITVSGGKFLDLAGLVSSRFDLASGQTLNGTGTVSGPEMEQAGSLAELTQGGKKALTLPNGETRTFLEDGDTVTFRGWCEAPGAARFTMGEVSAKILPARE